MRKQVPTDESGFTLMEILIVVILLGILAMVVVPQITISSEDTKVSTLQSNLSQLRSLLEIYYAQHNETYPGVVDDTDGQGAPADAAAAFVRQLTLYTKASGESSNSDRTNFGLGPYIKSNVLPPNPFNNKNTVVIDNSTTDLTARTVVASDHDYGYKFFTQTGILIACDGGTSNGVDHASFYCHPAFGKAAVMKQGSRIIPTQGCISGGGFSMMDAMLVVLILAVVAMVGIPQFKGLLAEVRLNEAAAELISGLHHARSLAVEHQRPFGLRADASEKSFAVFDVRYRNHANAHLNEQPPVAARGVVFHPLSKTPYSVNLESSYEGVNLVTVPTGGEIRFYPDGHSSETASDFVIELDPMQRRISVDGTTGQISAF